MYKLSFNNVFIPRKIDEIIEKEKQRLQQLLQQEVIKGDLDLSENKFIRDLGNIKRVEGYLDLSYSSIRSLGSLKYVGGSLYLHGTTIQTLNNLEYVEDDLWLFGAPIQSLSNLKHVGGDLDLRNTQIQDLGNLRYVGGDLLLIDTPLSEQFKNEEELKKYIKKRIKIKGKIYV